MDAIERWRTTLCICRHERHEHRVGSRAGGTACQVSWCPCESFEVSEDQTRCLAFVGTIDQVEQAIRELGER